MQGLDSNAKRVIILILIRLLQVSTKYKHRVHPCCVENQKSFFLFSFFELYIT